MQLAIKLGETLLSKPSNASIIEYSPNKWPNTPTASPKCPIIFNFCLCLNDQ